MMGAPRASILLAMLVLVTRVSSAQYLPAEEAPIQFGQVHLYVPDIDAQQRFWSALGTERYQVLTTGIGVVKFPNTVFFINKRDTPRAITRTTLVHLAVHVKNLATALTHVKALGFPVVTETVYPKVETGREVVTDKDMGGSVAFVRAPDNILVGLIENRTLTTPVRFDHVRYATTDPVAAQQWYVSNFKGRAGRMGSLRTATFANGVSLAFLPVTERPASPTGQTMDHIGFQLAAPAETFQAAVAAGAIVRTPWTRVQGRDRSFGYIEDPWGTWIETNGGNPGLVKAD